MINVNETHNPELESWVDSANVVETDFPIQNLPFGVFVDPATGAAKVGIAIGNMILDVAAARANGVIGGPADDAAGGAVQAEARGLALPWQLSRLRRLLSRSQFSHQ